MVHNAAMFSIVTICTVVNLDVQSISYVDSREFPGVDGVFPSGPIGYQGFIHSKGISFVATIMFILNNWSADGLLVSSVLDPAPCQSPYFIFALFALLTSLLVKYLHSHPLYYLRYFAIFICSAQCHHAHPLFTFCFPLTNSRIPSRTRSE